MAFGSICTISDLIKALDYGPGYEEYSGIIKSLDLHQESVESYCKWNPAGYTRNLIVRSDAYELLVMCWEKGHQTSIHNYDNQMGWIYIVEGELIEELHTLQKREQFVSNIFHSNLLKKGSFSFLKDDTGFHRYKNTSAGRTISLHLYTKPLKQWVYLDEASGTLQTQTIPIETAID